jgi:gliding motility-associated-like protein
LGFSQRREAQKWRYGNFKSSELDFGFKPVKRKSVPGGFDIGVASICDSNGNHQFCGNVGLLNRNDVLMPNGDLQPRFGYPQFGCYLIIPFQSDKSKFHYIFVSTRQKIESDAPPYFIYDLTIDMRLDGGLGDVDTSKTAIIDSLVDLQIGCMLHANARDSWLISRGYQNDSLLAYLVTDSGVVKKVITDINSPVNKANLDYNAPIGSRYDSQLKSSPDSKLLLIPRRMKEYPFSELLQFDRETGNFSNKIIITDTTGNFNITNFGDGCFSPDSRLLYYSIGTKNKNIEWGDGPGHFWQFDISNYDSASIAQSKIFLGRLGRRLPNVAEPWPWAPKMQLAMDGKIYISPGIRTDKYMSTIRCPDKRGSACGLEFRTIDLGDGKNGAYFPVLNQTFVRNAGIFQLQANKRSICQNDTLELSGYGAGAERFQWSVSPAFPASVKLDSLTWQKISTRQLAPGTYTFSCRAFSRCGDVFEKTMTVEVKPLPARPIVTTIKKTVPCKGDSVILKVQNPVVGNQYFWSTGDTASFTIVRQTGLYSLDSVSNAVGCVMKVGDTLAVSVKNVLVPASPVLESSQLVEVCAGVQNSKLKVQSTGSSVIWNTGQTGDSVSVSGAGKYWAIHQTEEGCTSAASDTITVVVEPLPVVQLVASDNGHCLGNEETKEYKVITQNVKVKSFEVEGGEVVEETDSTLTVHWFEGTQTQAESRLTIKSQNRLGCAGADLVFSPVPNPEACRELYPLFIPNLVTANNDNLNDRWEMGNILYHQPVSVRIYNRWGQTVFETDSYQNNWPNTGLSSGTYFYRVTSFGKEWKGWMTLN